MSVAVIIIVWIIWFVIFLGILTVPEMWQSVRIWWFRRRRLNKSNLINDRDMMV